MSHVDLATYTENLRVCVLSSTSLSRVELHLRVHFLDPRISYRTRVPVPKRQVLTKFDWTREKFITEQATKLRYIVTVFGTGTIVC